jgi:hypothetical protein
MPHIYKERMTVELDGDFVVFLIGMRINKLWKVHKWLPIVRAMPRMINELQEHPELGFLGYTMSPGVIVQYWRSFDHLETYARSRDHLHLPVWVAFNKRVGHADGDVGIWHETYLVQAGDYEAIYGGMPAFGLGTVGRLVPINGLRDSARGRLRQQTKDELIAFEK